MEAFAHCHIFSTLVGGENKQTEPTCSVQLWLLTMDIACLGWAYVSAKPHGEGTACISAFQTVDWSH